MYKVLENTALSDSVFELKVEAPEIAKKVRAGQFLITRTHEGGERIPFTFSDWDAKEGWIKFIFMRVGKSTHLLSHLCPGDHILDVAGPLGFPTDVENKGRIVVVGGGVGTAVAYPVARALVQAGAEVTVITGARTAELLVLQDEIDALDIKEHIVVTDDGTAGEKALVTAPLDELCQRGEIDNAFVVGPAVMMKFCSATTEKYKIPTMVSLNPLMIDGTGMCGACRININGETKFGCVDGPDFDAHTVNWNELMNRQRVYAEEERLADGDYSKNCRCHEKRN